jgi:hypothetical protein
MGPKLFNGTKAVINADTKRNLRAIASHTNDKVSGKKFFMFILIEACVDAHYHNFTFFAKFMHLSRNHKYSSEGFTVLKEIPVY